MDAAEAQLKAAHDTVSFTELRADAPGVITEVGPAAGEVVQAGQTIARLARQDGRDAVFDVPANMISAAPADPAITVTLTNDPGVIAKGRVREVAPQADPVTRTFEVKVGLTDPPEAMRLGATVTGRLDLEAVPYPRDPRLGSDPDKRPAGRLGRRPRRLDGLDAQRRCAALRSGDVAVSRRARHRRGRRHGRRAGAASRARRFGCSGRNHERVQPVRVGAQASLARRLLHDHGGRSPACLSYFRLGRRRGSGLHHQDDGRAGRMARRDRSTRRCKQVTERLERNAAGNAESRLPAQLHHRRGRPRSSSI